MSRNCSQFPCPGIHLKMVSGADSKELPVHPAGLAPSQDTVSRDTGTRGWNQGPRGTWAETTLVPRGLGPSRLLLRALAGKAGTEQSRPGSLHAAALLAGSPRASDASGFNAIICSRVLDLLY